MCACEPGFTCSRCVGTPDDPRYPELPDEGETELRYGGRGEGSERGREMRAAWHRWRFRRQALRYIEAVERTLPELPRFPREAIRKNPRASVEAVLAAVYAVDARMNGATGAEASAVFEETLPEALRADD